MSRAAAVHPGSRWYRPKNEGRYWTQIAAQRYAAELLRQGRITRGEKVLLDELSRWVDGRGICQKSIAFLAERMGATTRTVQRYLRNLCPNKQRDPEGWEKRILTRQYIHAVPEPGKKPDNLPSWFRFDRMDPKFMEPSPSAQRGGLRLVREDNAGDRPARRRAISPAKSQAPASKKLSPGGVENVTQAVIIGSETREITVTPPSLEPPGAAAPELVPPDAGEPAPTEEDARGETPRTPIDHPRWQPKHPDLVVLAARLFASHASKAPEAVARLEALGLTHEQIAAKLRRDSKDRTLSFPNARHPLLAAVSRAEKAFLTVRAPPPANDRQRPAYAEQRHVPSRHVDPDEARRMEERSRQIARLSIDAPVRRVVRDGEDDRGGEDGGGQHDRGGPEEDGRE